MTLDDPMAVADLDPSGVLFGISTIPDLCAEAAALGLAAGRELARPASVTVVSAHPLIADMAATLAGGCSPGLVRVFRPDQERAPGPSLILAVQGVMGDDMAVHRALILARPDETALVIDAHPGAASAGPQPGDPPGAKRIALADHTPATGALPTLLCAVSALAGCGAAPQFEAQAAEAVAQLRRQSHAYHLPRPDGDNAAKLMGRLMLGRLPCLIGASPVTLLVARYWRNRLARYAKVMGVVADFDDIRGELMGWVNAVKQSERWSVVALRERDTDAQRHALLEATLDAINPEIPIHDVFADGDSPLERLTGAMYFGEFVATYAALLWGMNPAASH